MTIRRLDQTPVVPTARSTETKPANTVKANTAERSTRASEQSGFTPAASRPTTNLTGVTGRTPGPVAPTSVEGQAAIQATLSHINQQMNTAESLRGGSPAPAFDASKAFSPKSVERDELGMTHVRMDRMHEGVKVFGEQVIGHMGADGKFDSLTGDTTTIPAGLGKQEPKLSSQDALAIAQKEFAGQTDRKPTVERVVYKDAQGQYHSAYRAELTNTSSKEDRPRRMNYLIDANTGKMFESYNQMGGIELDRKPRSEPKTVTGSATPNAAITDLGTTTSKISLGEDVTIDSLKLDLDLAHSYRGDLKVSLTSPSGKTAVISDRAGGGADDLKGSFDLSAFKGEKTKGEWTLTVEDKAKSDTGTLKSWSLTATAKAEQQNPPTPPTGKGDDVSLYSGTVDLSTKQNADGSYSLDDSTRGKGVVTLDAQNKDEARNPVAFNDTNNAWGEAGDNPRTKAAVDAHYGAQMTYDMYKNVLGRDSLDGKGEKLVSNVHIGTNFVNAYWDGEQMNYGDGNGKDAGPLTTLDIAGHEITHGLTERTAGLIYRGESGGLNEAMSDIMGTGVEWYASQQNAAVKFDWAVGEDAWTPTNGDPNDALRYMDDPTADGYSVDNYKNYPKQTEVHGSSGIANNAFYLLANGGTNKTSKQTVDGGIGMDKGLKIYYRALAHYMTPSTTFAQAREATIKAATDLFGATSTEVQKVKDSWAAVGVAAK
ncbi:M4 family metallopeptidase [Hyalangium rubrum]|uniref:M4 family metallopeptidase n=1 Tax=Hyalangium rubrum TaxID=3103134 RepID=A0ABU5H075_9BACT|nr:M4 family metallopeptidase [Hyalangium sp. s54d21]MDY7226850.1 M4 family metallopeptidase [Hyalangium sp. s54d21]